MHGKGEDVYVVTIWILSLCFSVVQSANSLDPVARLYTNLTLNHVMVRPSLTTKIELEFALYHIKSLDGKTQVLSTFGHIVLFWDDPTLTWDPNDYEGLEFLEFPTGDLWRPTVGLRNSAGQVFNNDWMDVMPVLVKYTGEATWAPGGSFETSCDLNMMLFPFDTQECSLDWGNLISGDKAMNLTIAEPTIQMQFYTTNKEFAVTSTWVERREIHVSSRGNRAVLPIIKFWMRLQRKPASYLLNIIVPAIVLALLSAFTFIVPVNAGEKLSLSITVLLSFSVFLLLLADITPQTSDNTPLITIYLASIVCIAAMSLLCTTVSLNMYNRVPLTPIPAWLRTLAIDYLGKLFLCNKRNRITDSSPSEVTVVENDITRQVVNQKVSQNGAIPNGIGTATARTRDSANTTIDPLLQELRKLTANIAASEAQTNLMEEWMLVANITDRFFFSIFLLIHVVLLILFFVILPFR